MLESQVALISNYKVCSRYKKSLPHYYLIKCKAFIISLLNRSVIICGNFFIAMIKDWRNCASYSASTETIYFYNKNNCKLLKGNAEQDSIIVIQFMALWKVTKIKSVRFGINRIRMKWRKFLLRNFANFLLWNVGMLFLYVSRQICCMFSFHFNITKYSLTYIIIFVKIKAFVYWIHTHFKNIYKITSLNVCQPFENTDAIIWNHSEKWHLIVLFCILK